MQFDDIPRSFFSQIFQALNFIALVAWGLLVADASMPGKHSLERVTEIEVSEGTHTSETGAEWPVTYLIHTTGKTVDGTEPFIDSLIAVGDTVKMRTSPFFGKVYELGIRKKTEICCLYDIYPIDRSFYKAILVFSIPGILLQLLTVIPRISFINRATIAFFAYVILAFCGLVYAAHGY